MCENKKLRLFGTVNDSIVDGPGIRFGVFVQGCPHNCPGCHNPGSHDPAGGYDGDIGEIFERIKKNPLLDGVTFSGGEPFMQAKTLAELARLVHGIGLDVVTYTGFTFEELMEKANEENGFMELLEETDILVDGRFVLELRDISLLFKGSSNQRILDVKKSLAEKRATEIIL